MPLSRIIKLGIMLNMKVGDDFGHDIVEGGGGVYLPRAQVGAYANSGLSEKVWTKTKNPKVWARTVLQDISNKRIASSPKGAAVNPR